MNSFCRKNSFNDLKKCTYQFIDIDVKGCGGVNFAYFNLLFKWVISIRPRYICVDIQ